MENQVQTEEPKRKTRKDFVMLFLAIAGLIVVLLLLKLAITKFHLA